MTEKGNEFGREAHIRFIRKDIRHEKRHRPHFSPNQS